MVGVRLCIYPHTHMKETQISKNVTTPISKYGSESDSQKFYSQEKISGKSLRHPQDYV